MITGIDSAVQQEEFAALVGITQPRVAQMLGEGVLPRGGTARQWLLSYCERLREQAGGRGQELTMERAQLARSQRVGQDLKNAVLQREYAPIGLLSDVLSAAAAAVSDRFEALNADLRKVWPDIPEPARVAIDTTVASARNEWVRSTQNLMVNVLDDLAEVDIEAPIYAEDEEPATPPPEA